MNIKAKITRKNDFITADMDGSTVTMDPNTGKYYNMGKTGGYIWNHLEQEISVEELLKEIQSAFSISEEVCKEDVLPFLDTLLEKGLLDVH